MSASAIASVAPRMLRLAGPASAVFFTKPMIHLLLAAALPALVMCAVAVGGGVGGGALYMPIYVMASGDAHVAVPWAKVTTNGVAWAAFLTANACARHPVRRRETLIDYDVALLLEPLTLVGTIGGVIANVVLTNTQVLFLLLSVLSLTAAKTLQKSLQLRARELAEAGEGIELPDAKPLVRRGGDGSLSPARRVAEAAVDAEVSPAPRLPWIKLGILVGCWAFHIGIMFHVGGPISAVCGHTAYGREWLAINVAVQLAVTLMTRHMLMKSENAGEREEGQGAQDSHHSFTAGTTVAYPVLSAFAGVCAGALGIAGGLIKGPLMLNWGMAAQASTATAIFMILFTSSSTIVQFFLLGRLHGAAFVVFWLTGFAGGMFGSRVVLKVVNELKLVRQSAVGIFLGVIVVLSMLCMSGLVLAEILGFVESVETNKPIWQLCTGW